MTVTMKPGEWGTRDGKPAIAWHRPGIAANGEPSRVQEVRTYASEVERFEAHQRGLESSSADMEGAMKAGAMRATLFWEVTVPVNGTNRVASGNTTVNCDRRGAMAHWDKYFAPHGYQLLRISVAA